MKSKKEKQVYQSNKGKGNHKKNVARRKKVANRKKGQKRHLEISTRFNRSHKEQFYSYYRKGIERKIKLATKTKNTVKYGEVIKFLAKHYMQFSNVTLNFIENGKLLVPETFSISENNKESMFFLKRLFNVLYTERARTVIIDYKICTTLDVDAIACMDLIIVAFRNYWDRCAAAGIPTHLQQILLSNYHNEGIENILSSVGSFKNVAGKTQENPNPNNIPFEIRVGDNAKDPEGRQKEIHETEIVDYVVCCLKELNYDFNPISEKNLSKVIGEIMANAEEHSKFRYRFAIGYFEKPKINGDLGVFNLTIFNFGQTIYQSFKDPEHEGTEVVQQMKSLSEEYTRRKFLFWKKRFKEEVLWTLYSLQEGVTSVQKWTRGKGTIRFIESFYKLGHNNGLMKSHLTLISGNTHIIFDGTYPLKEKIRGNDKVKVMTFNAIGDISELPDEKFVTFIPQTYFPGTLISAKIYITNQNIS